MNSAAVTSDRRVQIGGVLVVAALAGVLAWLIVRDDAPSSNTEVASPAPSSQPRVISRFSPVSVRDLREAAASLDRPIYWAGRRPGTRLSLGRSSDGRFYVRYVPPGVRIEDPRPNFLVVATYPVDNAFAVTKRAAKRSGATTRRVGDGIVYYSDDSPTNAWLAYPGRDYQIEVFHPQPRTALRLVTTGRISPVG